MKCSTPIRRNAPVDAPCNEPVRRPEITRALDDLGVAHANLTTRVHELTGRLQVVMRSVPQDPSNGGDNDEKACAPTLWDHIDHETDTVNVLAEVIKDILERLEL